MLQLIKMDTEAYVDVSVYDASALRDLLGEARAQIIYAHIALSQALFSVHYLASRCDRAAVADHDAERRVLQALLMREAKIRDVDGLEPMDFDADGHAALFAAIWSVVRLAPRLWKERATMPRGGSFRQLITPLLIRVLGHLGEPEALEVLGGIAWNKPLPCPVAEICLVRGLAWRRRR